MQACKDKISLVKEFPFVKKILIKTNKTNKKNQGEVPQRI